MKKGEVRDIRLATMIAEELDLVLCSGNDDRLAELSITRVEAKPGGGHFTVYLIPEEGSAAFGSVQEMKSVIERAAGFLRSSLASALKLKRMPEVSFVPDPTYSFGL